MGDDDTVVTTFYVEGEVSLHWDRRTGELTCLHMNSTLFPDDRADKHMPFDSSAHMRLPLDSSAIASSSSVDDNMLPLMSESVVDVNPHATSSPTLHKAPICELDSAKPSCTNAVVYPAVMSSNAKLMPHTQGLDCAESSCTNVGVHPRASLSNNTRRLRSHDRDSSESSHANVGVTSLEASSNTKCESPPHKGDHTKHKGDRIKPSSTVGDAIPHVSSTSVRRLPTHAQGCTKSSCEPQNVEEKDSRTSPECSSVVQSKCDTVSSKSQVVEQEVVDVPKGQGLVIPQGANEKQTGCKPSIVISPSKEKDFLECKKDVKRIDVDMINLPRSTRKKLFMAPTLSLTEKDCVKKDVKRTDVNAIILPPSTHKNPSFPSDSLTTDPNVTMHGPSLDTEPSEASLSSVIPSSDSSPISTLIPPSTHPLSVDNDKKISSHPSSNEKHSENATKVQPISKCESSFMNAVTPCIAVEKPTSKMPKKSCNLKPLFSFGCEKTMLPCMPSVDSPVEEKKSSFVVPGTSLIDAKSTASSPGSEKVLDSSLSKRVSALPGKRSRKGSREVDSLLTPLITDAKPALSPWFSSVNASCNSLPLFTFTSSEKSSPCPMGSESMSTPWSSNEKTSNAAADKIGSRESITRTEESSSSMSSTDEKNSICLLRSPCKDGNCPAARSFKEERRESSSSHNATSLPSPVEKMDSKCSNVPFPLDVEAKKPLPADKKLDSLSPGQVTKQTSEEGTIGSLTTNSCLPVGVALGSLSRSSTDVQCSSSSGKYATSLSGLHCTDEECDPPSSIKKSFPTSVSSFLSKVNSSKTTPSVIKVTSQSSTCDENGKDRSSRKIPRHKKRKGGKRATEADPLSSVPSLGASSLSVSEGSLPDSLIDDKPANSSTNLKSSSLSSSKEIKISPPKFASDEKPAVVNPLLNSTLPLEFASTFLAPFAKEVKPDPSPIIHVTRQPSMKTRKRPSEGDPPSTELPAQSDNRTTHLASLGDAKSSLPTFSIKKTSPVSPKPFDFASTFLASSAKEIKPDPSPIIRVTRQQSMKTGRRPREGNPPTELPAQSNNQTTSLGDAKSSMPTFSMKKTSPVSPKPTTEHLRASKRPKKGGLSNSPKIEAKSPFCASAVDEKPDLLLHQSTTRHQRTKARKRLREVDLNSKDEDSSPSQQLVVASSNHIPHYLDGPSSSRTSKDRSILNSRNVQDGQNKRRKKFQLSFRPMECCRPRNAFILFSMRERQKVAAANPHFNFGEISKLVARSWHNMSDTDKKPFRKLALEDASRYHDKVSESYRTWEHLADRGLQIVYVVDLVCEWLSQKLPCWAKYLSRSSLGSNSS